MKVLIVNKFLYPNGGSETYIFELAKELKELGHEVQFFGMEHPDRTVGNRIGAYTSNMDFHNGGSGSKLKKLISKLLMPFKIIYSFEAKKQIRKVLEDMQPDAVHLNNINFQITPSIIYEIRSYTKRTGHQCKIVFTAHDYQWICPNHMMYIPQTGEICSRCMGGKYMECTRHSCIHGSKARSLIGSFEAFYYKWRKTYDLVDTIICPSKFLFDRFAEDKILRNKLVMMHNFLTDKRSCDKVIEKKDYVLYFGRFDIQKGIRTLINSCKNLPEINFIFAGSGPLASELSGIDNITNVGFKSGEELQKLIEEAAFSVYPSEWYENCPFSVMESQMYGTPVIGADIGGIPELISLGDAPTGMLFKAGDSDDLTSKIFSLWTDHDRLSELTDNCKNIHFDDVRQYTEKIINYYK
ncbi:MAG: glycosyltransferase [Lachnospiraceae bacterium]|nr:glycosyltransferase [Candidatus Colinaster scatohippi]